MAGCDDVHHFLDDEAFTGEDSWEGGGDVLVVDGFGEVLLEVFVVEGVLVFVLLLVRVGLSGFLVTVSEPLDTGYS